MFILTYFLNITQSELYVAKKSYKYNNKPVLEYI